MKIYKSIFLTLSFFLLVSLSPTPVEAEKPSETKNLSLPVSTAPDEDEAKITIPAGKKTKTKKLTLSVSPKSISLTSSPSEQAKHLEIADLFPLTPVKKIEVPDCLLVPHPTPALKKEGEKEDERSWTRSAYKTLIEKTADKYQIDPQIIYATIMTESEGNPYSFRYEPHIKDASLGLGQILTSTAKGLGFKDDPKKLYDPKVSIDLIGKYHRNMLDKYGDLTPLELAIAYNAGSPYRRPVRGHIFRFQKWLEEG